MGHSDTDWPSVLHVPSIGLVVAGDAVYNGYHHVESATGGIRAWMKALDTVAALQPRNVVAGHRNQDLGDDPKAIGGDPALLGRRRAPDRQEQDRSRILRRNDQTVPGPIEPWSGLVLGGQALFKN